MSSTNINDSVAVAALLEQLKASAAWQELTAATSNPTPDPPPLGTSSSASSDEQVKSRADTTQGGPVDISPINGASVASLLSQLKPFSASAGPTAHDANVLPPDPFSGPSGDPLPKLESKEDRRNLAFRESLPILSELANDASFVATVKKMKEGQNVLERNLWEEREAIYTKYRDKFKVAQTKAQMIGTTVSQHEVNVRHILLSLSLSSLIVSASFPHGMVSCRGSS